MRLVLQDNNGNNIDFLDNIEKSMLNTDAPNLIFKWIEGYLSVPLWIRKLKKGDQVNWVSEKGSNVYNISDIDILDNGMVKINSVDIPADELHHYSAIAVSVRDTLMTILQTAGPCPVGSNNGWEIDGKYYFYEEDKPNQDGSLTGNVFSESEYGEEFVQDLGRYRISSDGNILRWPTSISSQREIAEINGKKDLEKLKNEKN